MTTPRAERGRQLPKKAQKRARSSPLKVEMLKNHFVTTKFASLMSTFGQEKVPIDTLTTRLVPFHCQQASIQRPAQISLTSYGRKS